MYVKNVCVGKMYVCKKKKKMYVCGKMYVGKCKWENVCGKMYVCRGADKQRVAIFTFFTLHTYFSPTYVHFSPYILFLHIDTYIFTLYTYIYHIHFCTYIHFPTYIFPHAYILSHTFPHMHFPTYIHFLYIHFPHTNVCM